MDGISGKHGIGASVARCLTALLLPPSTRWPADERVIAAEVARAGLTNDPLRHVYAGILRAVREIRTLVARAREPLPSEVQREAVQDIVRQATGEIARGLTRLMPWTIGAALAGLSSPARGR